MCISTLKKSGTSATSASELVVTLSRSLADAQTVGNTFISRPDISATPARNARRFSFKLAPVPQDRHLQPSTLRRFLYLLIVLLC
jgi:hypothetical protein